MDPKELNRLEAMLGMLGSDHDGERAAAGLMISKMAKKASKSVPELMKMAFAGSGQAAGGRSSYTGYGYSSGFDSMREAYARAERAAKAQAERERAARAEREQKERDRRAREERRREYERREAESERNKRWWGETDLLESLRELRDRDDISFSGWERDFIEDVCERYYEDDELSEAQRDVIERLKKKAERADAESLI
jgi:hypothetical protein